VAAGKEIDNECSIDGLISSEHGLEAISEAKENDVDITVCAARKMPNFNLAAVERLAQYCMDHHKTANDRKLGEPISCGTMMQVANSETA